MTNPTSEFVLPKCVRGGLSLHSVTFELITLHTNTFRCNNTSNSGERAVNGPDTKLIYVTLIKSQPVSHLFRQPQSK